MRTEDDVARDVRLGAMTLQEALEDAELVDLPELDWVPIMKGGAS